MAVLLFTHSFHLVFKLCGIETAAVLRHRKEGTTWVVGHPVHAYHQTGMCKLVGRKPNTVKEGLAGVCCKGWEKALLLALAV